MSAATTMVQDSWDPVWERIFRHQAWGKYPAESLIRFVARNFYRRDRQATRLLEIGCGPGANIWYMAREGFAVSGIDGSAAAIEQANERLHSEGLSADLRVGDMVALPWADATFDAVIDVEALSCNDWHNSERVLTEVRRVLKPGGLFYSRTFTDGLFIGEGYKDHGDDQYSDIKEGPLADRGFLRLTREAAIVPFYGKQLPVLTLDRLTETHGDRAVTVDEWVIVCQKADERG